MAGKTKALKLKERVAGGKPCFYLENANVQLAMTREGGHLGPLSFYSNTKRPLEPYYISPWQEEGLDIDMEVLKPLRGDFFCMPFGANPLPRGKKDRYIPHGETATGAWEAADAGRRGGLTWARFEMETSVRKGRVIKELSLVDGQNVLYQRHTIQGNSGKMPLGHHATLRGDLGELKIRCSPIQFGITNPYTVPLFHDVDEYYSLAPGEVFSSLEKVPTVWKNPARSDCSIFPRREGFVDILQIFQKESPRPGWLTAMNRSAGYLWFSLKDIRLLPSTVFWMENRGRHGSPWSGRNCCLGLEDVCGYFAEGLTQSIRDNPLSRRGIPTFHTLSARTPFSVSYIQGAVRIGRSFDELKRVSFKAASGGGESLTFHAKSGDVVEVPVQWSYALGADLP